MCRGECNRNRGIYPGPAVSGSPERSSRSSGPGPAWRPSLPVRSLDTPAGPGRGGGHHSPDPAVDAARPRVEGGGMGQGAALPGGSGPGRIPAAGAR